jgi:hypothetical protein
VFPVDGKCRNYLVFRRKNFIFVENIQEVVKNN